MKNTLIRTALLAALAVTAASCAKAPSEDYDAIEDTALANWMAVNAPEAQLDENGIYIEVVNPGSGNELAEGNWVRIDYTGQSLHGSVFVTRTESVARIQGTYTYITHYDPEYFQFVGTSSTSTSSTIPQCILLTLPKRRPGAVYRIYSPSRLAYSSSASSYSGGYEGQFTLAANRPAVFTIEITEVVRDPSARELALVGDATQGTQWGEAWRSLVGDSIRFVSVATDPVGDSITADSTLTIYYVGKFLDGFVFDTNIDSVAQRVWRDYTVHDSLSYRPSTGTLIEAFNLVLPEVTYGSWTKMIFTSAYGYGTTGSYEDDKTQIQPYTPLVFEFYIKPWVASE